MTFNDVLNDIKKLIGLRLSSIRPGAEITILTIDEEQDNLILITASGTKRSRPLRELRTIWDLLMQKSVVHVDEALHGSGTSRNQPETILANLPYVEWLKVNGKKNLAFVNNPTHPFGTLKEMDVFRAEELVTKLHNQSLDNAPKGLIVTGNVADLISSMIRRCPGTTQTIQNGLYSFITANDSFLIGNDSIGIPRGTYLIIKVKQLPRAGRVITIANKEYEILDKETAEVLLTV